MYLSFLDLCIQNHQGLSQSAILDAHTMRKGDDFTYVCVCQCKQVRTYEFDKCTCTILLCLSLLGFGYMIEFMPPF